VGYATAPSPTGPWTKYAYNPVLASNAYIHGAGHHAVTKSPDGKEMFIVYHTHLDTDTVGPRKLAIDRLRFAPNPDGGPDIMEVYGPTLTPQPMPSGARKR
jgi:GH43 family beta-xylosidase